MGTTIMHFEFRNDFKCEYVLRPNEPNETMMKKRNKTKETTYTKKNWSIEFQFKFVFLAFKRFFFGVSWKFISIITIVVT